MNALRVAGYCAMLGALACARRHGGADSGTGLGGGPIGSAEAGPEVAGSQRLDASPPLAAHAVVEPGIYRTYGHVTADGAGRVFTVSYSSSTGWDEHTKRPRFSCSYYLEARLAPGTRDNVAVAFNHDERRKASVEVLGLTTVRVHVEGGPLYGAMALDPDLDVTRPNGALFERDDDDGGGPPVLPFRHVTGARTYLYDRPDGSRSVSLVDGQNLLTIEERPGWVRGQYSDMATGLPVTGWIRTSDLASLP